MAITVISNIVPKNREANISNDAFFYVMDSSNIDFTVDGIQEDNTLIPSLISSQIHKHYYNFIFLFPQPYHQQNT